MKALRDLQFPRTQVTTAGIVGLEKALPGCKIKWQEPTTVPAGADPSPVSPNFRKPCRAAESNELASRHPREHVHKNVNFVFSG